MFVFLIEEAFDLKGSETVVTGKVLEGEICLGMPAKIIDALNPPRDVIVSRIDMFQKQLESAKKGENVGIGFREAAKRDISNWQVIITGEIRKHSSFKASIHIAGTTTVHEGFAGSFFIASKRIKGTIHGFPYDHHAKHGVGHPGQGYDVYIDLEQAVYIGENFPISIFGEQLVGVGRVLELLDDENEIRNGDRIITVSNEYDIALAIAETFGERVEPFTSGEIDAFYQRLHFRDAETQARFPRSKVAGEMNSYIEAMIEWSTPNHIQVKKPVDEELAAQAEQDREFDTLFAILQNPSEEGLKELQKLAFLHEKKHSDAILLYGLYCGVDVSRINEAAFLKKSNRAAYLLGWMNETNVLYKGLGQRSWYREAAERGYQPAIRKVIDLISSGKFHAPGNESDKWKEAFTGEDPIELERLEKLKQYVMAIAAKGQRR